MHRLSVGEVPTANLEWYAIPQSSARSMCVPCKIANPTLTGSLASNIKSHRARSLTHPTASHVQTAPCGAPCATRPVPAQGGIRMSRTRHASRAATTHLSAALGFGPTIVGTTPIIQSTRHLHNGIRRCHSCLRWRRRWHDLDDGHLPTSQHLHASCSGPIEGQAKGAYGACWRDLESTTTDRVSRRL